MLKLYEYPPSGNCYKIRLLLTQLEIPFERISIDIVKGETRTPEFLEKNPNGKIPLLELEAEKYLAESNAIIYYFSQNTPFFPTEPFEQAQVMQWMFFEQYSHEPNIATSRYWISVLGKAEEYKEALQQKHKAGNMALSVMEEHLKKHEFFVGNSYSIADICLFAYTHVADEGGFNLTQFPQIENWIQRVKQKPKYIPITQ
ncbi:MAG: glutathione S-transferase family protein [Microcoleaceae cyanobacterium]